ncbi:MAG: hypothetical protein ACK559_19805, partial [bacterium]
MRGEHRPPLAAHHPRHLEGQPQHPRPGPEHPLPVQVGVAEGRELVEALHHVGAVAAVAGQRELLADLPVAGGPARVGRAGPRLFEAAHLELEGPQVLAVAADEGVLCLS